jgi:quercetin dioxygenase-like cupin family protein
MQTIHSTQTILPSFLSRLGTERSYWYNGGEHLFTFLANAEETNGAFSVMHIKIRKGFEPPPHIHSRESESYYVLDGKMTFSVGNQSITAGKGDFIYLPNHVVHGWHVETDWAEVLVICEPAGLERFFLEFSEPSQGRALPDVSTLQPPTPEQIETFIARLKDYGVTVPMP